MIQAVYVILCLASLSVSLGFSVPSHTIHRLSLKPNTGYRTQSNLSFKPIPHVSTSLQMGYNLPPGGGGRGEGGEDGIATKIGDLLTPIVTIAGLVLFFMSPLGGIFFAITNSLFVLALLTPILIGVGFNVWNYFNTIEATCPSCGAPARVLKDIEAGPNICLNCGQLIRATADLDGIELCNDPNDIFDEKSRVSSFFDIFTSDPTVYEETTTTTTTSFFDDVFDSGSTKRKDKERREKTIIDVDIEKDWRGRLL